MTTPDLRKVEEIFHAALECAPDQLRAFLDRKCAGDKVLRREVEALLALHRQAGSFIETPIVNVADSGIGDDQENDLLIGQTIGHYKISQRISAGGMGEVYLAADTIVGRKAALKFLHARFTGDAGRLKRFQQEARAVAGLNHPNILTIYEVGEARAVQYIASELIEGETLRQRLVRGRIQLSEAVEIAIQVTGALAAAHSAGIVHRDVKPENIMLRPDGYVKVLDFGIAKLAEQELPVTVPEEEALLLVETNLGSVLGTVRYMSPEQARGSPVDKRTDIWSLGIVLYEMAVGHAPFVGDTPREVMTAILKTEPRPLSSYTAQIPGELGPIVSKALQKDPEQRYQNASEMLGDLKGLRRKLELAAEMAKSAPEKSIAVLPFENLSADKGNAYFADGIQEEILTRLSRIGDLKVISRTSTQRFRDTTEPIREIARQLGVATILEGSVSKAGDKVRVHVQLIDAENDVHVWAERYDRELVDIFAVESDIAENIANALKAKLTRAERRAITSRPTRNLKAYQLCLKARHQWKNFFAPGYEKVREYYEQAVALDPSYAPAQTGLSAYYAFGAANGFLPPDESWPRAEEGMRKSLALDDTLPGSYHLLAGVELFYNRDWPAAERAFRHAAELDPNLADIPHHYALCLALFGRNEEALAQIERAALLDPFFPGLSLHRGTIFFFLRDYDSAIKRFAETLETYPDYAAAHEHFGDACAKKGMLHEAITQWSAALALSGQAERARALEQVFATAGFEAAVRNLAQRQLEDLDRKRAHGDYVPAADYVFANVRRGSIDAAFEWLPKMVEERNWFALQLRVNPILDLLRGDPRFDKIVESLTLK
jgi:eukaryotic-like serine/threonine-protein kinase